MSDSPRKKKKQIPPPKQLRYLISSLNTPFGRILCDTLSTNLKKNELAPLIYGSTVSNPKFPSEISTYVKKTVDVRYLFLILWKFLYILGKLTKGFKVEFPS